MRKRKPTTKKPSQSKSSRYQPKAVPDKQSRSEAVIENSSIFQARNKSQEIAWQTIKDNHIVFLLGPAGTSKTHLATAYAISAKKYNQFDQIVVTRPLVEAHEHLGWLPGEVEQKVAPYMEPIFACNNKISKNKVEIITKPIAYMRGVTFENSIHILDEAQNCTRKQLQLYLTRFGRRAKIIICGDTDQADIPNSGLESVVRDLHGLQKIGIHRFTNADIVRHPLVGLMLERFNESDKRSSRDNS